MAPAPIAFALVPGTATPTEAVMNVSAPGGSTTSGTCSLTTLLAGLVAGPLRTLLSRNGTLAALVDSGRLQVEIPSTSGLNTSTNLGTFSALAFSNDTFTVEKADATAFDFNIRFRLGHSLDR